MLRFLFILLLGCGLIYACKPLDERIDPSPADSLRIEPDSGVRFDTVFTELKTATQRMLVYNPNSKAIIINEVSMVGGAASPFTFYINGRQGPVVNNLEILGGDSAYVLISGKLPVAGQNLPLVIEDRIQFKVQGREYPQYRSVIAKGQDAHFLTDSVIDQDVTWHADKPYVIFGNFVVAEGATLSIDPCTRIYIYNNVFPIILGNLHVNGTYECPVHISGTRLEQAYANVPGQWGYIQLLGGTDNRISHAIIENGIRGVQLNYPDTADLMGRTHLKIDNTMIRNMSDVGLWAFNGQVEGLNLVMADCGSSYIAGQQGGSYAFSHCTLAQSGNTPFNRKSPALVFTDFFQADQYSPIYRNPLQKVNLYNNLVSGTLADEFFLYAQPGNFTDSSQIRGNFIVGTARKWRGRVLDAANGQGNRIFDPSYNFAFHAPMNYDFMPDSAASRDKKYLQKGLPPTSIPASSGFSLGNIGKDFNNASRGGGGFNDSSAIGALEAKL